jgi:pSer/pThr/pTyr-binding forkhead associated (FHA) protein
MPSLIHRQPDGTEQVLAISAKPLIIGRLVESEIQIRDAFISRVHAGIGYVNNQFTLKDFGSANGTYRNGARVFECPLTSGDRIQVGNTTLVFEIDTVAGNGILRHAPTMVQPGRSATTQLPSTPGTPVLPRGDKHMTIPVSPLPPLPK